MCCIFLIFFLFRKNVANLLPRLTSGAWWRWLTFLLRSTYEQRLEPSGVRARYFSRFCSATRKLASSFEGRVIASLQVDVCHLRQSCVLFRRFETQETGSDGMSDYCFRMCSLHTSGKVHVLSRVIVVSRRLFSSHTWFSKYKSIWNMKICHEEIACCKGYCFNVL